jgi:hypothetical protein
MSEVNVLYDAIGVINKELERLQQLGYTVHFKASGEDGSVTVSKKYKGNVYVTDPLYIEATVTQKIQPD